MRRLTREILNLIQHFSDSSNFSVAPDYRVHLILLPPPPAINAAAL
jgi:hypothetical protein